MSPRRSRTSPAAVFFAILSLVLAAALVWVWRSRPGPTPAPVRGVSPSPRPRPGRSPRPAPAPSPRRTAPAAGRLEPAIALLIDDLGNDRAAVRRIASWPYAVAGAVLPDLPGSAEAARALSESGKEVLLHLPMEPEGFPAVRPGPGVVLRSQSAREITETLERDLATVPGAVGVNNHMGSAATADPRVMNAVVAVLARRGLFFVDSRTTLSTVARDSAEAARVPSASRRVFLDDLATDAAVRRSFDELVRHAREEGPVLAIGHPHPATLAVLERELPDLKQRGVRLVRLRDLVQ